MTYKIVDISDEIYRELGEPSDLSLSSIAFWLRTNIGDLNILTNKKYYITEDTLEIGVEEGSGDEFKDVEKSIFKMIYSIHYYERLFRNALGAASTDSLIEINQNGFSARKINKNELAKTYAQLRKQIADELQILTKNYNLNEARPLQVAGDDTIPDLSRSVTYSNYIRNIDTI
jgi:beta-mannanase